MNYIRKKLKIKKYNIKCQDKNNKKLFYHDEEESPKYKEEIIINTNKELIPIFSKK